MIYTENAINVLATKTYKGIGRAWLVKNLSGGETVDSIVSLLNRDAKIDSQVTCRDFEKRKVALKEKIAKLEGFADGLVAIGDADFPAYRGNVKKSEQPVFLFYRGDLTLLRPANKNVAVIGLLSPDADTEMAEREVIAELVKNGVTIVSGLALGCDTIAHEQALKSGGKTIAILPSPLDAVLPAANRELAAEIVSNGGLLVTEYYEDARSKMELGGRYQERDRLQALFSDSIVLAASWAKNDQGNDSGSRLAMGYASDYGIPRAVIYDEETDANNPKYDLNRQLISEQKDITVISRKNLSVAVGKLIANKPLLKADKQTQPELVLT